MITQLGLFHSFIALCIIVWWAQIYFYAIVYAAIDDCVRDCNNYISILGQVRSDQIHITCIRSALSTWGRQVCWERMHTFRSHAEVVGEDRSQMSHVDN